MMILIGVVLVLALLWGAYEALRPKPVEEPEPDPDEPLDPFAGGFPVPAMPGQKLLRTNGSAAAPAPETPALEEVRGG